MPSGTTKRDTALFARNLLKTGELTAWDGVNLNGYGFGMQLDENLNNPYMPPLQYYVAAMGFKIFGISTFAGRIPFCWQGFFPFSHWRSLPGITSKIAFHTTCRFFSPH